MEKKKLVVVRVHSYLQGHRELYELMTELNLIGIKVVLIDQKPLQLETENVCVRYICAPQYLDGIRCNQAFGFNYSEKTGCLQGRVMDEPFDGSVLQYIRSVEEEYENVK